MNQMSELSDKDFNAAAIKHFNNWLEILLKEKLKNILAKKRKLFFKRSKMKIIEQQNITSEILKACWMDLVEWRWQGRSIELENRSSLAVSYKVKHTFTIRLSKPTPWYLPYKMEVYV